MSGSRRSSASSSLGIHVPPSSTSTSTSSPSHSCHANCPCRTVSSITTRSPTSPRTPLTLYTQHSSFEFPSPSDVSPGISETEQYLLETTTFKSNDVSAAEFDFEDVFTYDNPQKKLSKMIEVSIPTPKRDWNSFSFSHYAAAVAVRRKGQNRVMGIGQLYARNRGEEEMRK